LRPLFYTPYQARILNQIQHQKKGNGEDAMGSKSKTEIMKSYKINKKEAEQKFTKLPMVENQKRENALDIISKSLSAVG
jgi:hypothetical protein